jgi:hypothetical protein
MFQMNAGNLSSKISANHHKSEANGEAGGAHMPFFLTPVDAEASRDDAVSSAADMSSADAGSSSKMRCRLLWR